MISRVDIRAILTDPVLRRRLLVMTLIATQAREGRVLTQEEAEDVYDRCHGKTVVKET